jgi:hypothetical protein
MLLRIRGDAAKDIEISHATLEQFLRRVSQ